ncbi:MAG TPA: GNAT family N-acetyltransferase [Acidimicrobiia bacterium]|nr:GNAT family N-acetyltransferase [Acidimicrobiia bacterium]
MSAVRVLDPSVDDDLALGRALLDEYIVYTYDEMRAADFAPDIDLDHLRQIIADHAVFAERYSRPSGAFLVVETEPGAVAGCVGLSRFADGECEMNRLFIRPGHQGTGLGRLLTTASLDHARALGYRRMVLEVVPYRTRAIALYRSLGFTDRAQLHEYPFAVVALALDL